MVDITVCVVWFLSFTLINFLVLMTIVSTSYKSTIRIAIESTVDNLHD